jgi:hypothetical protein
VSAADDRYTLRVTPTARRQVAEVLPEAVATAAQEFIVGPLLSNPHRMGKRLRPPVGGPAQRPARHLPGDLPDQRRAADRHRRRRRAPPRCLSQEVVAHDARSSSRRSALGPREQSRSVLDRFRQRHAVHMHVKQPNVSQLEAGQLERAGRCRRVDPRDACRAALEDAGYRLIRNDGYDWADTRSPRGTHCA